MKLLLLAPLTLLTSTLPLLAQARAPETASPPPPPIYPAPAVLPALGPVYVYDQKPMSSGRSYLIAPQQAESIINRFKDYYKKSGNPRFLIYVNRQLVDENVGLKLSSHKQVLESTRKGPEKQPSNLPNSGTPATSSDTGQGSEHSASTNIYRLQDPKELSLADRQTMRDVERLFGRPLRMAGAHLADQGIASEMVGGKSLDPYTLSTDSSQARQDREALAKVADVVVEILVSSHDTTVSSLAGDTRATAPDIQATAIRLSDAQILGQATAADLIGQGPSAGQAAQTFGIREITEATALSLMEDMMQP